MAGLTRGQMNGWRTRATRELAKHGFTALNPVNTDLGNNPIAREITSSNKYQIQHSDIVLAEFDRDEVSKGTVGEVVFASLLGKPVITWGGSGHAEHPWIKDHSVRHFTDLAEAVGYIVRNYKV